MKKYIEDLYKIGLSFPDNHDGVVILQCEILQAKLQQYMIHEIPDAQAGFRRDRGVRDQFASIHWIIEKPRGILKNIYFCLIGYAKAFDCVDHKRLKNS